MLTGVKKRDPESGHGIGGEKAHRTVWCQITGQRFFSLLNLHEDQIVMTGIITIFLRAPALRGEYIDPVQSGESIIMDRTVLRQPDLCPPCASLEGILPDGRAVARVADGNAVRQLIILVAICGLFAFNAMT